MPKKSSDYPPFLRPFVTHGCDFAPVAASAAEACGSCVFCGKHKLYVQVATGMWSCKVCGREGNVYLFLREVWATCFAATSERDYENLSFDRGVPVEHLKAFGWCRGFVGDWICPGYGSGGGIVNLYRRVRGGAAGHIVIPTPMPKPADDQDIQHGYFAPIPDLRPKTWDRVDVCEGAFDGPARRWSLSSDPDRLDRTLVIGTPGANVWSAGWGKLCSGKAVSILYDNDHPISRNGSVSQSGKAGVVRVSGVMASMEKYPSPASVACLVWGPDGFDPNLPSGYDVRDFGKDYSPADALRLVDERVGPVPAEWLSTGSSGGSSGPGVSSKEPLRTLVCRSWDELIDAWKDAVHYSQEFEDALTFALAVAGSVVYGDERLWGRLLGVAGSGKSMVCEGLSTSTKHCVTESIINSFYSGTKTEDGKDHSFANRLWDMLWINNDADTMRTHAARETIFAQMRDLYGGKGSKAYGNGIGSRSYHGLKFGVLFAGTPALCELDSADLGARFIDFSWRKPDSQTKFEIAMRAMDRQQSNGSPTGAKAKLLRAKQLTGGYLEHLRATYDKQHPKVYLSQIQSGRVYYLAEYVAKMRSRPPKNQEERFDLDEMPTRLCMQLTSLAVWASVVRGKDFVDAESMRLVKRCATDTAIGRTANIVQLIYDAACDPNREDKRGVTLQDIARWTRRRIDSEADLMNFLCEPTVNVLCEDESGVPGLTRTVRYRLTDEFAGVYRAVWK